MMIHTWSGGRLVSAVLAFVLLSCANGFAGTPTWSVIGRLPTALQGHAAVMVHTGDVLIIGGVDGAGRARADVAILRGGTGRVDPALGSLQAARFRSAVVAVADAAGRTVVYVIGGYTGSTTAAISSDAVDVITYDPARDSWRVSPSATLPVPVGDVRAVYDGAGTIIVSGGTTQQGGLPGTGPSTAATSAITIGTGSVRRLGDHVTARSAHGAYRFLDALGVPNVLVGGGDSAPSSSELLAGSSWDGRANPPRALRRFLADVSDISGTARAIGGEDGASVLATTEWFDPKSGWKNAPRMNATRSRMGVTLVAGPVDTAAAYLVASGRGSAGPLRSTEIFHLPSNTDPVGRFDVFLDLPSGGDFPAAAMTMVNLPVVVGGGASADITMLQPLEAFDVTFPATEVGAISDSVAITITNTWLLPVRIVALRQEGQPDFLVARDTSVIIIPAGGSRTILSWFRPTSPGPRSARLVIDMGPVADTVVLRGNALASTLALAATGIDHGDVPVGTSAQECVDLLVNNGSDTAVVDSVTLPPGVDVRVVQPVGRIRVAPGDTMTVCTMFDPRVRGALATTGAIHTGGRSFPFSVIGRGIRTVGRVLTSATCDTVNAVVGDTLQFLVVLENAGDRPLTVSTITIDAAVPGTAWVADASILPLVLQPQTNVPITIAAVVRREGAEQYTVRCASTSDTSMTGVVCVAVRSRTLQPSITAINVGTRCLGDTMPVEVVLVNPSTVETVTIDAVVIEGIGGDVEAGQFATIPPRGSVRVQAVIRLDREGTIAGRMVASGPFGSFVLPIMGTVLPSISVDIGSRAAVAGDVVAIPITLAALPGGRCMIDVRHSRSALRSTAVRGTSGVPLDPSSSVTSVPHGSRIEIVVVSAPTGPTTMEIVMDVLRGEETEIELEAVRSNDTSACVLGTSGTVRVDTGCGGERSGVRSAVSRSGLMVMPNPVRDHAVIVRNVADAAALDVVDVTGTVRLRATLSGLRDVLDTSVLPAGRYSVRLLKHGVLLDVQPLVVVP